MFNLKNYKCAESEQSSDVASLAIKGDLAHFPEQAKTVIDKTNKTLESNTPDKSKIEQIKNIPQTKADRETLNNYGMVDAYVRLMRYLRDRQPAERVKLFDSVMANLPVGQRWTQGDVARAKDLVQKVETNNLTVEDRMLINSAAVQTLGQTIYNQIAPQLKSLLDKQQAYLRKNQIKASSDKISKNAQEMNLSQQNGQNQQNPLPILPVEDVGEFISKMLNILGSGNEELYNQAQSEIQSNVSEALESDASSGLDFLKEKYLGDIMNEEEIAITLTKIFSLLPAVQNSGGQTKEPVMAKTFNLSQHILNNDPKYREILQKEAMQKEAYTNLGDAYLIYGPTEKRICPKLRGRGGGKAGAADVVSEEICRFHCLDGLVIDDNKTICGEAIFRGSVMDKFSREYVDKDGNIVGGYLNKRFEINRNVPEENKMRLKPGELRKPRPAEWGNTESRLQAMRAKEGDSRGYEPVTNSGDPFIWSSDVDQNNVEQSQEDRDKREEASGHQTVEYTKKDKQENNPKMPKTASAGISQLHFLLKKLEAAASPIEAEEVTNYAIRALPQDLLKVFLQESDKKFADKPNKTAQLYEGTSDGWENQPAQVPPSRETKLKKYPFESSYNIRLERAINNVAAILDVDGLSVVQAGDNKYRYMVNGIQELAKFIYIEDQRILFVKIYPVPGIVSNPVSRAIKFFESNLIQKIHDLFESAMAQDAGPSSFASNKNQIKRSFNAKEHKMAQSILEEEVIPQRNMTSKNSPVSPEETPMDNTYDEILYQLSVAETEEDFRQLEETVSRSNYPPKEIETLINIINNTKNSKLGEESPAEPWKTRTNPHSQSIRRNTLDKEIDVDAEGIDESRFASKKSFNLNKFKTAQNLREPMYRKEDGARLKNMDFGENLPQGIVTEEPDESDGPQSINERDLILEEIKEARTPEEFMFIEDKIRESIIPDIQKRLLFTTLERKKTQRLQRGVFSKFNLSNFKKAQMTGPRGPYGIDNPQSDDLGLTPDVRDYDEDAVEPESSSMTDEYISQINNAGNDEEIDRLISEAHGQASELGLSQRDLDEIMDFAISRKEHKEEEPGDQNSGLTSFLSNIQKIKTAKAAGKITDLDMYSHYIEAMESVDDLEYLKQIENTLVNANISNFFLRKLSSVIINKRIEISNPNFKTAKKKKTKGVTYKGEKFKVNPWAVCNTTTKGKKEEPEKFERCVKRVKSKSKAGKKAFNLNRYKTAQMDGFSQDGLYYQEPYDLGGSYPSTYKCPVCGYKREGIKSKDYLGIAAVHREICSGQPGVPPEPLPDKVFKGSEWYKPRILKAKTREELRKLRTEVAHMYDKEEIPELLDIIDNRMATIGFSANSNSEIKSAQLDTKKKI